MGVQAVDANGGGKVTWAKIPDWVELLPFETVATELAGAAAANGLHPVLLEAQIDLSQPGSASLFYWTVRRVLSPEGVDRAAHVLAEFDPAFERLEFHGVRIWRGDETIEHGDREAIQVFRPEPDLARKILDGRMKASLIIPDVRIGDVVETTFTRYQLEFGARPETC